jgi:antitoxin component of RelBE/YafQ-DinJ toxin-antitoxin module
MTNTVAIDANALKAISAFASKHGMSANEYIEAVAIEAADDNYLPASKLRPNDELIAIMQELEGDIKRGHLPKSMNRDEAMAHLQSIIDQHVDD